MYDTQSDPRGERIYRNGFHQLCLKHRQGFQNLGQHFRFGRSQDLWKDDTREVRKSKMATIHLRLSIRTSEQESEGKGTLHSPHSKQDIRLFHKILNQLITIPYPGDLKQIIRSAVAFSDDNNEYDYLRKLYSLLLGKDKPIAVDILYNNGFTIREIEILTRTPKSTVARLLKEGVNK